MAICLSSVCWARRVPSGWRLWLVTDSHMLYICCISITVGQAQDQREMLDQPVRHRVAEYWCSLRVPILKNKSGKGSKRKCKANGWKCIDMIKVSKGSYLQSKMVLLKIGIWCKKSMPCQGVLQLQGTRVLTLTHSCCASCRSTPPFPLGCGRRCSSQCNGTSSASPHVNISKGWTHYAVTHGPQHAMRKQK